jgi:hypothetical protein
MDQARRNQIVNALVKRFTLIPSADAGTQIVDVLARVPEARDLGWFPDPTAAAIKRIEYISQVLRMEDALEQL